MRRLLKFSNKVGLLLALLDFVKAIKHLTTTEETKEDEQTENKH